MCLVSEGRDFLAGLFQRLGAAGTDGDIGAACCQAEGDRTPDAAAAAAYDGLAAGKVDIHRDSSCYASSIEHRFGMVTQCHGFRRRLVQTIAEDIVTQPTDTIVI